MCFIRPTDKQNESRQAFWHAFVRSLDLQHHIPRFLYNQKAKTQIQRNSTH